VLLDEQIQKSSSFSDKLETMNQIILMGWIGMGCVVIALLINILYTLLSTIIDLW
jgi:hypothetical protein